MASGQTGADGQIVLYLVGVAYATVLVHVITLYRPEVEDNVQEAIDKAVLVPHYPVPVSDYM